MNQMAEPIRVFIWNYLPTTIPIRANINHFRPDRIFLDMSKIISNDNLVNAIWNHLASPLLKAFQINFGKISQYFSRFEIRCFNVILWSDSLDNPWNLVVTNLSILRQLNKKYIVKVVFILEAFHVYWNSRYFYQRIRYP